MVKCVIFKITPEEYNKLPNFTVTYGTADTRYGKCFMGLHEDAVCFISFVDGNHEGLPDLKKAFPKADFTEDNRLVLDKLQTVFDENAADETKILLKGTDFQIKVWEELVKVPKGSTCSYEDVAKAIGNEKAVRAVATAVGKNNVPYLVPCHRVIRKGGAIGKYGGGVDRKIMLLRDESAI